MQNIDNNILTGLFEKRSDSFVSIFSAYSFLASITVACAIIFAIIIILTAYKKLNSAMLVGLGFAGAEISVFFLKKIIERPRPDSNFWAIMETNYALPSGHATASTFVFGLIAYLFYSKIKNKFVRALVIILAIFSILLMDLSRLYLGVHYFSDVLVGNILGLVFLIAVILLDKYTKSTQNTR